MPIPFFAAHFVQRKIRGTKTRDFRHLRRAGKFSIQGIGPSVIGTGDSTRKGSFGFIAEPSPSVPADVVKGMRLTRFIPRENQTFVSHFAQKITSRLGNLLSPPHTDPLAKKMFLKLFPKVSL